ncbi:hypothetical protein A0256_21540 [Mucilaginibacter sp. PAMC 26640]|nr:hypothetical protein A0256_21540 [Mucilaginibacter sp. PAMC 26640]
MRLYFTKGCELLKGAINNSTWRNLSLIIVIASLGLGCKKNVVNSDRDYGYAKLTVACQNKCNVKFYGSPDKVSNFDVEKSTANYYIRYKENYNLNISVTPTDADQNVDLYVYSRAGKEIFKSTKIQKLNESLTQTILIP